MKPELALHRLAGVFQGLEHYTQTGAPMNRERLAAWARKQQEFIDEVLDEHES